MAILLPHLIGEVGLVQPERVGDLLFPIVGTDIFAVTAADLKIPRTIALFWEFFDALNTELSEKIPSSLREAGLTDEQMDRVQSRLTSDSIDDDAARILESAKHGAATFDN
jgi:hypothetical protein